MAEIIAGLWKNRNGSGDPLSSFNTMKVDIIRPSRVIGAPVEDGRTAFDNKVRDPKKVVVTGTVVVDSQTSYSSVLEELNKWFENRDYEFYYASDGINSVGNLVLQNYPTTRETDRFDFIRIELTFLEAMLVQSDKGRPSNAENSDTRNLGNQQGMTR